MKNFLKKIFNWDNFVILILGFFFLIFLLSKINGVSIFSKGIVITTLIFSVLLIFAKKFLFKNKKPVFKYIIYFVYMFVFAGFLYLAGEFYIDMEKEKSHIAFTKDIELANEIQKLNKGIIIEKRHPDNDYELRYYNYGYGSKDEIILKIAKKYQNGKNLIIVPEVIFYDDKHPEKYQKKLEKAVGRILGKIDGVKKAEVKIKSLPKLNVDENPEITINLTVLRGYDEKEIERITQNLCDYKTDLTLNINYEIDEKYYVYWRYEERALDLLNKNKEKEANEIVKEVETVLGEKKAQDLLYSLEKEKKRNDLNKKIEKDPNNYKYYVERGEIERGKEKIEDYQMALFLNPKYEYKDYLNFEIAEEYFYHKDYEGALEYYKKVENGENVFPLPKKKDKNLAVQKSASAVMPKKGNPYWFWLIVYPKVVPFIYASEKYSEKQTQKIKNIKNKAPWDFFRSQKNILNYRIYKCQEKLKLYEEAYETCKKQVEISEQNGENPYYIYESMVSLDFKMKNYKQAWADIEKKKKCLNE